MSSVAELLKQAQNEVAVTADPHELDDVRVKYLGKKGSITSLLKSLGKLPANKRAQAGKEINTAKDSLIESIQAQQLKISANEIANKLALNKIDITLSGRGPDSGNLHPITQTLRRIKKIFALANFEVRIGPEIEDDYHNFTALNIPEDHPARAMHDTFYLNSGSLLRTHTSPVQIRAMQKEGAPIRLSLIHI